MRSAAAGGLVGWWLAGMLWAVECCSSQSQAFHTNRKCSKRSNEGALLGLLAFALGTARLHSASGQVNTSLKASVASVASRTTTVVLLGRKDE